LNYFIIACTIDTIEKNRRELKPATEEGASALRYAPPSSLVTRESAKLDTRFLRELMLTLNKNSNKFSAFLPILALGIVLAPALAGIVEPTSVSCGC
jgi:hypothetical protein